MSDALLPATSIEVAASVADRLRQRIAQTAIAVEGTAQVITVTVSIGVAALGPGESVQDSYGAADAALYEAKETGRNRVVVCAGGATPTRLNVGGAP